MDCETVRPLLADRRRGRLDAAMVSAIDAHVAGCARCRQQLDVEAALDAALDRLPRQRASASLRRQLEQTLGVAPAPSPERRTSRWPSAATVVAPLLSGCLAAALVLIVGRLGSAPPAPSPALAMVDEAVNDHLRVVSSTHPTDIESGGIHQVKPWFTGRLEFSPRVTFSGDDDFPLVGGSIGYFGGRKAAVFLFKRRLHAITLLVFEPQGLAWPAGARPPGGRFDIAETTTRGFTVLLWRDGELGYALVSDVNRQDLTALALKINQE
ncbi:MAG TPA: zf-HC2 domain-containing protein [Polyangia bacterium]|nr:zf-HC2 domain-containing protein [Polyangia bacterium]